ncbi:nuclear factor related to kappa-B-binding protein-like, partial [Limulus polyphemus]|uniref:Nuclear factor related to kappa-B-binding protein-like n=1 Tax=Limulus polyphemus TaxID=6850 RepID=A0ABM1BLI4_LIMPO
MNVATPLLEEKNVDYEGTVMEKCLLGNKIVFLPQEICEQEEIFKKVMSLETWDSVLSENQRCHLMKFLPSFSENDQEEKKDILRKLFDGENFKFGNPLRKFFKKLNDGVMAPDVAKMTALLRKATYREYRYQQQQYYCRLLQEILISRKKLLDAASVLPPHQHVKIEQFTPKTRDPTLEDRTKWRYFSELQSVREECGELDTSSEDENYPEGSPLKLTKKHKKQLHNLETALNPDMHRVVSTIATGSGIHNSGSGRFICRSLATCEMTEERYREMLLKHKRRKMDKEKHPELDVSNISLEGLIARTNMTRRPTPKPLEQHVKKRSKNSEILEKKSKTPRSTTSESQALDSAAGNSQEPIPQPPVVTEASNIKVENKIAPEQAEDDEDMDVDIGSDGEAPFVFPARASTPEQEGNLPVSFFSLLRDLFLSTPEMKMSAVKLEERVRMWLESPVVVGCDWLGGHDNWTELVSSALKYLAGDLIAILPENFVPYLDYKEKQQQWQWIGAGRDSDKQLCALCQQWQENLGDVSTEALESAQGSPPPPRVPTDWSVRPSNEEEKKSYREQECIRYQNPHKAYTFRIHGYEAVVGPVKGVYRKETGVNKAREHSLLVSDRPPFVTILSLVRDAAARLPNGEGTRADISELLKDSQYLAPGSDQQMYAMVSGALDRLHYEKDPCVKYDVNRKLWIYLHRNRTEEEFGMITFIVKAKETLRPASTLAMSAIIDTAAITTVTDVTVNVTSSRSGGSRPQ